MPKQLNVNLAFTAETSQAKASIMDLQSSLAKVAQMKTTIPGVDAEKIKSASEAAKELSVHLNNAFNAQTGNFDLSKFDKSLKMSSTNVTDLSTRLLNAGAQGEQAFVKLAQSIAAADRPVVSLSSKLTGLMTTLKNTAKWQISSSILHGFMGAVSSAYGYAQDLNESLNNIRIVTGANAEEMERFAVQANRAAKELSTTTTEYTNASLIFYQQGLSDDEVAARTEVTIKMANAAGESAEKVSDQLTAVWNNFYDGSKSLEYYADVMTALGAATASSTDEIAGGLEKFAAIGETIGLSYEYAASALATITSNTRQSEEVVGTALKTIFARIQGLELGDTLEDGLNLNKYSEALSKVGISIFDSSGELKKMDNILNEMAATWNVLNKGQQTALAQTVAGVRQYTQLIALMENWNNGDSDSMTANLETAYNSEGALQEQADIYAESWEAARDRVQASLESIYTDLLDDDFFIGLADGFSNVLDSVHAFIDGVGGIKTVVMGIGSILLGIFANKVQPALMNLKHNFTVVFQSAEKQATRLSGEMNKVIDDVLNSTTGQNFSADSQQALKDAQAMNVAKGRLQAIESQLTDTEKQQYELTLSLLQADQQSAEAVAEKITKRKEEIALLKEGFDYTAASSNLSKSRESEEEDLLDQKHAAEAALLNDPSVDNKKALTAATNELNEHRATTERLINAREQYAKSLYETYAAEMETTQGAIESSTRLLSVKEMMPEVVTHYTKALSGMQSQPLEQQRETFARLKAEIEQITGKSCPDVQKALDKAFKSTSAEAFKKNISEVMQSLKDSKIPAKDLEKILRNMGQGKNVQEIRTQYAALNKETKDLKERQERLNKALEEFNPKHTVTGIERITSAAAGLGQVAMLAQSCRSIFEAWNNDDLSFGEKLMTTFMSLSMIVPSAMGAFKSFNTALNGGITSLIGSLMSYNAALQSTEALELKNLATKRLSSSADADLTKKGLARLAVKKGLCSESEKELFVEHLLGGEKKKSTATIMAQVLALKLNQAAANGNVVAKYALAAAEKIAGIFGITLMGAKNAETGAVVANTAAWYANPIMWIGLIIVGVVAALAGLVAIIGTVSKALADAYNADAIAAEKADKAAKELASAYEEAKNSYQEMIDAMDKYQSARDALSELTKGTVEYSQALKEANQAALDLIDSYGQYLEAGDWGWEDGQLVIDDAALENAKKQKQQEVDVAQAASNMGAARAKEANAKAEQTAMKRDRFDDAEFAKAMGKTKLALDLSAVGVLAEPLVLGVEAGIGAALKTEEIAYGKGVDAVMKLYQEGNKNILDNKEELAKGLAQQGIVSNHLVEALYSNRDALLELGAKYDAAEQQARAAAQENARSYIDTNFGHSQYAEEMVHMVGNQYYEESQQHYDSIIKLLDSKTGLEEGAQTYFDQMGISAQQGFKIDEVTDEGTVKYSVIDEEGQRQEKEVSAEFIAQTLAAAKTQETLAESCMLLEKTFTKLDGVALSTSSKLEDIANGKATGNVANLEDQKNSAEGLKKFLESGSSDSLSKAELDALAGKDDSEMKAYLKEMGINEDNVSSLGYEDINALIEAMNLENTQDQWDQALDSSATGVDLAGMEGASDNLSLAGAENIKAELEEITNFFGEASSQMKEEWEGLTSDVVESLDETSQAEFWDQLGKIEDFESAEDWDNFLEQMKESGELTKEESEALEGYVDSAKEALKATEELNFEELAKSVKSLEEVMGSISEGNRNISDEQFAALEAEGIDTSKFAKTIDGWRYIGETGDFVKEAGDAIKSKFTEAKKNYDNITDKVVQASNNLTAAQAATASATAAAQAHAVKENQGRAMLAAIIQNIKDTIMTKIQAAWEKISAVCVQVYDFFAKIYNAVSQGISDIWNSFATWLEGFINSIVTGLAGILEALGFDTSGWEEIAIKRMEPDKVQTAAELEEELAAQKLDETVALLDENLGEMCNTIEASADYLSEEELQAGKDKVQAEKAEMEKQYEAIKNDPEKQAQAEAYKKILDAYDQQLASYDKAMASKQWGEIMGETGDGTGEAVSPEDVKAIEEYADALLASKDNLVDTREEALKVAAAHTRMEKGINSLSENWETWNQVMTDGSMKEQVQATAEMKQAMSDILGVDVDQISDDFVKNAEAMDLMKRAAEGDMEALDALGPLFAKEYIADIKINNENFDGNLEGLQTDLNTMMEQLQAEDLQIGTSLDQSGYATAMTEMMAAAGTDIETINNILSGLGFEPEVTYKQIPMDEYSEMVQSGTTEWSDSEGNKYTAVLDTTLTADQNGMVSVPVINGSKTSFVGSSSTAATTKVKNPGGKSGGNSKKETKKDPMKKDDVIDRYKETEDAIDDVSNAYDRASKAADRMYGAGRIAYMMKANKELLKEIGLLKQKKAQAEEYLKLDKANLEREAASAGVTLEFDSNGNIVNYTQELTNLVDAYNKMNEEAWKDKTYSEEETEALEAKEKQINDLTDAVQQYEETREEIEDIENEIQDKFYEWQDNNYEMWNHSLEVSLKMTGDIKDLIDGLMTLTEDDFFMQAEGLALMYGKLVMTNVEMGSYIGHLGVLSGMMATGAISPEKFIEGLDQVKEGAMNAAQALIELDKQMIEYYGNALEMAREEIDVYTDRMEHCTGVLEHYLSLLDLMGKKKDYKSRGIVLDGRVETLQNELDVIEREAKIMEDEANAKKRLFESTKWYPGAGKVFEQQYRDALAAATETQEEFLAKAEELAQALNDRLENTILESGQRLEDALTGGKGFSLMSSEMEHAVSLQEEWLTTTNKIYETEKLMNKAQQDIDKTTNAVAKRKLKLFIEETNQLKEKSRLSKFELDVQQAKYDLLLAEIALEESQNAKSQVRLQRDAEGNFGYIYTAEADAIAQAEQEYADKQNAFYNMALEGVNNYAEKYYQTLEEMYDTLADIDEQYRNGEFESWDAYQAARLEAENYYFQKLRDYSEIYNIAVQLDTRATKEAWGSEYDDMINKTDEWEAAVRQNASEVTVAFQVWERDMGKIADRTGTSMEKLASSVDDVVKESESLKDTLMKENGVLDQIERELDLVSALTAIYAFLRIAVMGAAMAYFMLAAAITAVQMATAIGSGISAIANSDAVQGAVKGATDDKQDSNGGIIESVQAGLIRVADKIEEKNNKPGVGSGATADLSKSDFENSLNHVAKKFGISLFDTGGYTGEWGSYGKLAMVHEKELILNPNDTENFLASMDLLDNIISTINLHAANQSVGGLVNSPSLGTIGGDTLEQTVTIEANFPNVSSRVEIEEAFSTLVNRASQYANRKQ